MWRQKTRSQMDVHLPGTKRPLVVACKQPVCTCVRLSMRWWPPAAAPAEGTADAAHAQR